MTYLYGDCSPSPLTTNYLGTLRRALELSVELLLAEDRLLDLARRHRALRARGEKLAGRIEALRAAVRETVGGVASAPEDDPVTRCANQIEHAVDAAVARALDDVHAQEEAAAAELTARERAAHASCAAAVATFLGEHELPGSAREVELEARPAGYTAIERTVTPYRVATERELDLAGTAFAAADARVAALVKAKTTALKLDKLIVTSARCDARAIELGLRAGGEGYDLRVERGSGAIRLQRVQRRGAIEAVEPADDDARALAALAAAVAAILDDRTARGGRLRAVTVDDTPLDEHERPSVLVDRVLAAMAPAVAAIVERSSIPGELRLLRDLGDSRREEIFVTHAALAELVAQVPVARRRHFDVLRLPGVARAREATAEVDPEMIDEALSDPSISIEDGDQGDGDAV